MKLFLVIAAMLSFPVLLSAQDGSDIGYLMTKDLDTSYVGRTVHFDFGNRSKYRLVDPSDGKRGPLDSVEITVLGVKYTFLEHREDDGYNNWFRSQYLESTLPDGRRLRLLRNLILKVEPTKIRVRAFFSHFDTDGKALTAFAEDMEFERKTIAEILVKADR